MRRASLICSVPETLLRTVKEVCGAAGHDKSADDEKQPGPCVRQMQGVPYQVPEPIEPAKVT
ncbi:MAG TPA: hypothetical protein ACQGQH_03705 [Xylella sp.]